MVLDQTTLFAVATAIAGLQGVFLLVLWMQDRGMRAMAWWGGAYLIGAFAVTLWGEQGASDFITPEMPNAFLFVACGMIWSGARLFHGRLIRPGAMFLGAVVWFLAMQFPDFAESAHARVALSSVVIALYTFLTAFELRRERRRGPAARWCWIAIPLLHSAVFLVPLGLIVFFPGALSDNGFFALFAFETVIYVVGTAFVVMVLAKEHVALVHKTAAMTDLLTGLFNRRAFLQVGNTLIAQRARKSLPISVLLFDLDKFKSINDRFGHAVGDDALKIFAATATANMRSTDVLGRLGGEEFAAIIPGTAEEAGLVAERLRAAFQEAGVFISGHEMGATVSIGVSTAIAPAEIDHLLARADLALYRAKHNGRNRIEFDHPEAKPAAAPEPEPQAIPALGQPLAAMR
jgi:diguanylate cyclase (GGDEF)-like protein